jgi:hypothetical protein
MANSQIVSIGSVAKFRGTYDDLSVYYYLNVVTLKGSVFQASGDNFKGQPPLTVADDGTVSLANTNVWNCVVDNTAIYNAALPKVALTDQVTALQTELANVKTSVSTEVSDRVAAVKGVTDMIGASDGIAALKGGKLSAEVLPNDVFDVIPLTELTDVEKTTAPFVAGDYYYCVGTKKLYLSTKGADDKLSWTEQELSKDKLYIDRSGRGIYIYKENNGLIKVVPQNVPKMAIVSQDEYDALVAADNIDSDTYYNILEE